MQAVSFVVEGHPNAYDRRLARLRYTPREVAEWRAKVGASYWDAVRHLPPIYYGEYRGPVAVEATIYGSRADADNLLKEIMDGLRGGPFVDDRQVCSARVEIPTRALGKGGGVMKPADTKPRAEVTVSFLSAPMARAA